MDLDALKDLTYESAQKHVGSKFQIHFEGGLTVDLDLELVTLLMEKHINPRLTRDAFSMQFRGPDHLKLSQAMYPIYHEQLGGPLPIFLVPIGRGDGGFLYEAVFN